MKIYTNKPDHFFYFTAQILVNLTSAPVTTVVVSQDLLNSAEFKAKKKHGKFPILELADGSMIFESAAIAEYLARTSSKSEELCGKTAFEQAEIQ